MKYGEKSITIKYFGEHKTAQGKEKDYHREHLDNILVMQHQIVFICNENLEMLITNCA